MKTEKRYKVTVANGWGMSHDVDNPEFYSDDLVELVNFLRRLYPNQFSEGYKKHTPKIVDRLTDKEYSIFAS